MRKAAQQALIVLQCIDYDSCETIVDGPDKYMCDDAYDALKAALAQPEQEPMVGGWELPHRREIPREALKQPEQEPVAIALNTGTKQGVKWNCLVEDGTPLYTAPPQRKPLTVDQISEIDCYDHLKFARRIEKAHGIGGEA